MDSHIWENYRESKAIVNIQFRVVTWGEGGEEAGRNATR